MDFTNISRVYAWLFLYLVGMICEPIKIVITNSNGDVIDVQKTIENMEKERLEFYRSITMVNGAFDFTEE